jgi:hypothetical protein
MICTLYYVGHQQNHWAYLRFQLRDVLRIINIVTCRVKAGITESELASIARQRLGSHFSAAIRAVNATLSG